MTAQVGARLLRWARHRAGMAAGVEDDHRSEAAEELVDALGKLVTGTHRVAEPRLPLFESGQPAAPA